MSSQYTKTIVIEGVPLIFPLGYDPPKKLADFPSACGAGKWGDYLVPEKPGTVCFTPACASHDACFELWPPGVKFFTLANEIFETNLHVLINKTEKISWVRDWNHFLAEGYLAPVTGPPGLAAWCSAHGVNDMYLKFRVEVFPDLYA